MADSAHNLSDISHPPSVARPSFPGVCHHVVIINYCHNKLWRKR